LPFPKNLNFNEKYAEAGTTWMDLNFNSILQKGKYSNWRRRQRGWMNPEGQWVPRDGAEETAFFCVEKGNCLRDIFALTPFFRLFFFENY